MDAIGVVRLPDGNYLHITHVTVEPFSAVEGGSCHIRRTGTKTMADTERTRRLREAESRLLELGRYL